MSVYDNSPIYKYEHEFGNYFKSNDNTNVDTLVGHSSYFAYQFPSAYKEQKKMNDSYNIHPSDNSEFANNLTFFDARLYKRLALYDNNSSVARTDFYPHQGMYSYVSDLYETPQALQNRAEHEAKHDEDAKKLLKQQAKHIEKWNKEKAKSFLAPMSLMHPYAVIRLAGASGELSTDARNTYDRFNKRRWYEIDGGKIYSGHYAKQPTTTNLIKWGNESTRGATPYSFQDFVFCKYWNKIENNRLITLRRYAAPVTDAITFKDYKIEKDVNGNVKTERGESAWIPLATAITYFGDETGNKLSDILSFSAKYNWETPKDQSNPINVQASQNDMGQDGGGLVGSENNILTSGLGAIGKVLAFAKDVKTGGNGINYDAARGVPPDPYMDGPYENRILGPINVIMDTYKRKRGLTFTHDNLKLKFEYVARPISGINSKAVLLDCLANILVMTYSHGSWFGGMWKYYNSNPALFPWVGGDEMNALYQGKIFGKDGFVTKLTQTISSHGSYLGTMFKGLLDTFGALIEGAGALWKKFVSGGSSKEEDDANYKYKAGNYAPAEEEWIRSTYDLYDDDSFNKLDSSTLKKYKKNYTDEMRKRDEQVQQELYNNDKSAAEKNVSNSYNDIAPSNFGKSIQKVIGAKLLKSATVPYLKDNRALLTGDVIGDWHLTIGNPFNPIAMIGNLICYDCSIKFSDELGPDDFPIGFTATITLKHGLGRDREAIESMFNRGSGRIYTLPSTFRSSADGETKVDDNTGTDGQQPGFNYDNAYKTFFPGTLSRGIINKQVSNLNNKGTEVNLKINDMESLQRKKINDHSAFTIATTYINPWQTAMVL